MKYVLTAYCSEEYNAGCDYALIDLTPELARLCLNRVAAFKALEESDRRLSFFVYLDYSPVWFGEFDSTLLEMIAEAAAFSDNSIVQVDDLEIPDNCVQRIDTDQMYVSDNGVFWRATPKHCDIHVETPLLSVELLQAALNQ